jgi:hypothetical protein
MTVFPQNKWETAKRFLGFARNDSAAQNLSASKATPRFYKEIA